MAFSVKSAVELSLGKALTGEVLASLETWASVLEWSKLGDETWKKIAAELGAEDVSDCLTISNVADEDYQEAAIALNLKGIAKALLNMAINVARRKLELPITDVFMKPLPAPSTPKVLPMQGSQGNEEVNTASLPQQGILKNGLSVGTIWNQGCKIIVAPLERGGIVEDEGAVDHHPRAGTNRRRGSHRQPVVHAGKVGSFKSQRTIV